MSMDGKKLNIGGINMELVRQALNENVTVTNGQIVCHIPDEGGSLNIGNCSNMDTHFILDINLAVQEDELLGVKSVLIDPMTLINTKNVFVDEDKYYFQCDGLLIYVGNASKTKMHLDIPAACTERSYNSKIRRDRNR